MTAARLRPSPARRTGRLVGLAAVLSVAALMLCTASPPALAQPRPQSRGAADLPFPLTVPPGFHISLVSNQIRGARFLAVAANGDVLVSEIRRGRVVAVRPGLPVEAPPAVVADALPLPNGLAFSGDDLYIATWTGVSVIRNYSSPTARSAPERLFDDMPRNRGHNARAVAVASDGSIFISAGSDCNVCTESDPRLATILRYNSDGSRGSVYASGLRNASGLAFDRAGRLWAVVNQRDNLTPSHTDLPPDELDLIQPAGDYGWPSCYPVGGRRLPNPEFPGARCGRFLPATFEFQAHSAPLQAVFYDAQRFPASYQGNLFVAFHGSWNRDPPTGYKVVAVSFSNGRPTGLRDFVTGWLTPQGRVLGRPVGVAVGPDGSLYISDDTGYLFRVTYGG